MFAWFLHFLVLNGLICLFVKSIGIHEDIKESSGKGERHFESSKRGVLIEFSRMIKCATGRSAFDFLGYGCWCGLGGKGTPVDDLDGCCQAHDFCYDSLKNKCPLYEVLTYFVPYSTKSCRSCEPASYYWFLGQCRSSLCECDAAAAKCFAEKRYNERFKNYPNKHCKH